MVTAPRNTLWLLAGAGRRGIGVSVTPKAVQTAPQGFGEKFARCSQGGALGVVCHTQVMAGHLQTPVESPQETKSTSQAEL